MADENKAEQGGATAERSEQGCAVKMHDGRPCGRPIFGAYPILGGTPVCLMHSRDPKKDGKAFQEEIERILAIARDGVADFSNFVFPSFTLQERAVVARCIFRMATFTGFSDFSRVEFREDADFRATTFEGPADFDGAVFTRSANFREALFKGHAGFMNAIFYGPTGFTLAKFADDAYFGGSTFVSRALFLDARFLGTAEFSWCTFDGDADFRWGDFKKAAEFRRMKCAAEADFREASFSDSAIFEESTFVRKAIFHKCRFRSIADLSSTTFSEDVDLSEAGFAKFARLGKCRFGAEVTLLNATFEELCDLSDALFEGDAIFVGARFQKGVDLRRAKFSQDAKFIYARFGQDADFSSTAFARVCDFRGAVFHGAATFRDTSFRCDQCLEPGPVFPLARFERPERTLFYKTHLGQALLHNCDVSAVTFSAVDWRLRANGKRMVFDEIADVKDNTATALQRALANPDERDYVLVAEIYQQLKKNYDERRDYWTAGDWHYGEMEMRRLATPPPGRLARWIARLEGNGGRFNWLRRWLVRRGVDERRLNRFRQQWHRHMGLAAWYKRASEYGESYGRPAASLAAMVLLFTLLYPLAGLTPGAKQVNRAAVGQGSGDAVAAPKFNYWTLSEFVAAEQTGWALGTLRFFGHSLMTTLGVAFFQRDLEYQPLYPWGRVLAWAQLLLTYTLVALFLLALRRQFRR
jgi:uncharacterized protein YjbI with pentapeptide repeats